MRVTGTLHSIGLHHILPDGNNDHDNETIEDRLQEFNGFFITTDDETLRAASNLLYATVDIYPHPVNGLVAGECTPENYAHALARLAHAEDHLAREVRSSQALAVALEDVQAQCTAILAKQAEQERLMMAYRVKYHEAERALNKAQASLGWTQAILARCVPPDFGVVPALSYGDDVRENAWSQWWETNTPSEDDKIALARGDLEDESKLGTIQTPSPTSFDDEDDCDRYTPRGG
jgi:hypothetical protein